MVDAKRTLAYFVGPSSIGGVYYHRFLLHKPSVFTLLWFFSYRRFAGFGFRGSVLGIRFMRSSEDV